MALFDENSFETPSSSPDSDDNSAEVLNNLLGLLTELEVLDKENKDEVTEDEITEDRVTKKLDGIKQQNRYSKSYQSPQKSKISKKIKCQDSIAIKLSQLEQKINQLDKKNDLEEVINILWPLMTELLDSSSVSEENIKQVITPVIDQIITKRFQQDRLKMSKAIADILPIAIAQEIENSPQEIAKAIAPEMALAIQNQIQLDREAIAQTLGPEMGQAIKNQIEVERDAMVDALYPVIGNTISKYMVELAKSINDKVENTLSIDGIRRKIQAKIQGVSEAELILQESINFSVQAVLLIHKSSGLIISQVQSESHPIEEVDLWAAMLTAIRDFVNDRVAVDGKISELHEIEYDDAKIILEVAGYCYLAVIIKGETSKTFLNQIRKTLSHIILKSGRTIENFNGDQSTIPQFIDPQLKGLINFGIKSKESKPPIALIVIFSLIIVSIGTSIYRYKITDYWEREVLNALDAAPELSVYRIIPEVKRGQLILTGRVPNLALKEQAENISHQVTPHLTLNNQIVAVNVPPDAKAIAGEVQRIEEILNQTEGVAIKTNYQNHNVTITGFVLNISQSKKISQAFQKIPGVEQVITTFQTQPYLETRLYFDQNSSSIKTDNINEKLKTIEKFLAEHPQVHLIIIGHSDTTGSVVQNEALAQARVNEVKRVLLKNKVDASRLTTAVSLEPPPGVTSNQPLWLSRCVRFEILIPPN
ncbi:OmpA family protein [Crocosphaera chwakensis]|uniref:OmpA/MotB n=1 Tax=Crocosphaera chwakensis CCY0110 TaxID=391612 RepID=A3IU25_9CHRO|nr:OmpA family protein [Crocosphaera chwakensis]EAZ89999.1 OmpA/MotB [Crocosphaera chwakensis CCY0110]